MPKLADDDLPQGGRRRLVVLSKLANHIGKALTDHAVQKISTKKYPPKTRRRAQSLKNIRRKTSRRK
jgi:hypothetical protein